MGDRSCPRTRAARSDVPVRRLKAGACIGAEADRDEVALSEGIGRKPLCEVSADGARLGSRTYGTVQTAPVSAPDTSAAYLASTPSV
jgi:hypothetical protein